MRRMGVFLSLVLSAMLLAGCGKETHSQIETLWVVTEATTYDGMNYQARQAAEEFELSHPGITVRLDILPLEETERETYLKELRTQMLTGQGPDVYLLPTGTTVITDGPNGKFSREEYVSEIEPLFSDVTQAMRTGMFSDVSTWYDADEALNTAQLQAQVMEAGTLAGKRYVLPLRYTMPVLLYDPQGCQGQQLEMVQQGNILELAEYALETGDVMMALGLRLPQELWPLGTLFNYAKDEMVVTVEDIARYMSVYQQWYAATVGLSDQLLDQQVAYVRQVSEESSGWTMPDSMVAGWREELTMDSFNSCLSYWCYGTNWQKTGFPVFATDFSQLLDCGTFHRGMDPTPQILAYRNLSGQSSAQITYFGAVGASCPAPETAYEYLRLFLTEAYQWDGVRIRTDRSRDEPKVLYYAQELQVHGLVEKSWPVRALGAITAFADTFRYRNVYTSGHALEAVRRNLVKRSMWQVTDEDVPILYQPIDEVSFPVCLEGESRFSAALAQLNEADGTPTDVDIPTLAQNVWTNLWWHLAEG